ncbi:MAG: hypothetical protein JWQ49_4103 [Edaphobacter sp.]|nr:hypothetical protein [Edaphobacter sp.]
MSRRVLWTLPLLFVALCSVNLHAQARFAIYGTGGGEKSGLPNDDWHAAGTFGFYYGLFHFTPIDLSVDARGDLSGNIKSGFLGPRVAVKLPIIPIKPYGEFIFGVSTYNRPVDNDFAYRYVLGLDTTILPHIDWRVADFSYALNTSANGTHAKTLSSGLVIRF